MGWLRALFGPGRGSERALHRMLRERGASRSLRRFAEPFGSDAEQFWNALPRGTWALRAAARLGVSKGLIAAAMSDLAEEARARREDPPESEPTEEPMGLLREPAEALPGVSDVILEQVADVGRIHATRDLGLERFAGETTALLLAVIDADPEVRTVQARMEEAQRWGRVEEVLKAMDLHDAAYARRHAAMAKVVRRHIGAHEVALAIRGTTAHPYR
jgi:hypothetical protein